jgi:hypothetical protein
VQAERVQRGDSTARPALHPGGEVFAGLLDHQPWPLRMADQADRRARHAQADFDFRTHRHPLDERPERLGEEGVALVSAVVAHRLAEQAGRHAEADFLGLPLRHARE